jgi:chromate transporter
MESVSFREAIKVWTKIGWLSFGGPAGQIALMHKELVDDRKWIDDARFLHALNYCMLLPGPEAQQLAVYIGWLMHRTRGGVAAGLLFVLPGFLTILALSLLYVSLHDLPAVAALFFGLKAAVVAVVAEAVQRVGKRALKSRLMYVIAALGFVALFVFAVPFPVVVLVAGLFGFIGSRVAPALFPAPAAPKADAHMTTVVDAMEARGELDHTKPSRSHALRVLGACLVLWFAPVLALALLFGRESVFVREGLFFSNAAVVTFGGAYSVLAYIAQRAVATYGWLMPGEMIDGLGLAETTPGPLIMVVQFVGFLGAFRHPGGLPPYVAAVLGSVITVWVTFVPCFLWILLGAPYIEALRGNARLHAALSTITAAVVGVILNLAVWFGVHVVFRTVTPVHFGPIHLLVPELASIDFAALGLSALALVAMLRFHLGLPKTLGACAALGIIIGLGRTFLTS